MGEAIMVGMAEVKVSRSQEDVLIALGLGSCIGVCAYDVKARVAGMAHIVLPDSAGFDASPSKFADTAIPHLLEMMIHRGAAANRIRVAIVGGAQLFAFHGSGPRLDIGPRNTTAVKAVLEQCGLELAAVDVGGTAGRSVHMSGDGRVRVRTIGKGERELASLANVESGSGHAGIGAPVLAPQTIGEASPNAPGLDAMRRTRE